MGKGSKRQGGAETDAASISGGFPAENRWAEESVEAEHKRLNDVLETLPAYLVLLTPDYHVPFANRFFRERFGESNGLRCFEYLFGRNEPCEVCETFKVLKTMVPHEWEWTGPDGRNYYIYDFPFTDTDGSALIMEMGIDITDRKRVENELRRHKEHLEDLVRERTAEIEGKNVRLAAEIAERRQAEEALRRAKEDWERTFDRFPDMIAILDDRHRIMRVNPAMARRLGRTPDDCVGLPCYSAVHGTDAPPAFCPHKKTLADGGEYTAEVHEERLGGDFLVSTTPISDGQGRMIGSVHVARDITELKHAEARIRSLALFPEENPFPVLRASVDGTLISANRAAAGLLDQWQCRIGASVPETVQQLLKATAESGRNQELEIRCNKSYVSLALVPVADRGYVNFYGRDITEHKLAEKALKEREDDLNRAQAVAHFGSWRLDIQKNELLWSDETYRIFGIPKGTSMTYKTFMGAVYPDDREYVDQAWNTAILGWPYDIEHRIVVGDSVKWVRERAELELDEDGKVAGGFGIVQDITEKKRAEEALQKAHDELELRVHERTAELLKMNEALKQSNRDLADFAHVASHDLQEPLRKIQTFSDRLITGYQESLDDNARDFLRRMQRAAGRMQDLILDVLKYSRVRTRPEPFAMVNLQDPAGESLLDLKVIREETQAKILIDELPVIEADPVQMRQLFQNLLENALKYRGEESPAIRVYSVRSHTNGFSEIHIEDNGIGFDEQYLDRIFKPFQRLHWQSSPYPGTGMGLAICRRIVERHGGSITARSLPGKGSTFIVTLPIRQKSEEERGYYGTI